MRDDPSRAVKSGRPPSIPVSMTATPMPLPVACGQTWGDSTEYGYAVASRDVSTAAAATVSGEGSGTCRPADGSSAPGTTPASADVSGPASRAVAGSGA